MTRLILIEGKFCKRQILEKFNIHGFFPIVFEKEIIPPLPIVFFQKVAEIF